jgi:ribonuclease T1
MAPAAGRRPLLGLLAAVLVAALLWWTQGDGTQQSGPAPADTPSVQAPDRDSTGDSTGEETDPTTDPVSGLPVVRAADLPPEARDVLARIDEGGPFKYPRNDGVVFENREDLLPEQPRGYYREYTVESAPDVRGPMRIVTGAEEEYYWTDDHYRSFSRIAR